MSPQAVWPNTQVSLIEAASEQKENLINAATRVFDLAEGVIAVVLAAGLNTLTLDQSRSGVILLQGNLGSAATAILDGTLQKVTIVRNDTSGSQVISVKTGASGAPVQIDPGPFVMIWPGGSQILGGGSGGGVSLGNAPAALDGASHPGVSTLGARMDHGHADRNRPTDGEKDALDNAEFGSPGISNPYILKSNPALTDARNPLGHAATHNPDGGDHPALATSTTDTASVSQPGTGNAFEQQGHQHKRTWEMWLDGQFFAIRRKFHFLNLGGIGRVTDDATADEIRIEFVGGTGGGVTLSAAAPQPVDGAAAAVGTDPGASHGDHHHPAPNMPTTNQKAALVGTGTPSASDLYVNSSDARMANARTPIAHAAGTGAPANTHNFNGSDPLATGLPVAPGDAAAQGSGPGWSLFDHVHPLLVKVFGGGSLIGARRALNFIGAGVTASLNPSDPTLIDVNVPGGGGGGAPVGAAYLTSVSEPGLSNELVFGSNANMIGLLSARPASAIDGADYIATDVGGGTVYRYNLPQARWDQITTGVNPALSSDSNSLVPGNLLLEDWNVLAPTLVIKSRPALGADGSYLDTALLNPFLDAPGNGGKIAAFATPPGVTSVTVTIPMKLITPGAQVYVAILDQNFQVHAPSGGNSATFTLAVNLTNYTFTSTTLAGNTEYFLWLRVRDAAASSTQYTVEAGPAAITPVGGTGVFGVPYERYHIRPEDMWDNMAGEFYSSGPNVDVFHQSMAARVTFETTADNVSVEIYPRIGAVLASVAHYVVLVNGRLWTVLQPVDTGYHLQQVNLSLPPGRKRVDILTGVQAQQGTVPNLTIYPCSIRALYWSQKNEMRILRPPRDTRVLVVYGDSITGGWGSTYPSHTGWVGMLRQNYPATIVQEGRGNAALYDDSQTTAAQIGLAKRIASQSPSQIWLAMGTNDYGFALWSAANFGAAYAKLLDLLHQFAPQATIFAQTPITRQQEAANSQGSTMGDYRAQITNAAAARSWVNLVDGTTFINTGDLTDGVHPNTIGHHKYFLAAVTQLANAGNIVLSVSSVLSGTLAWPQATIDPRFHIPVDIPVTGALAGDQALCSMDSLLPTTNGADGLPLTNSVVLTQATVSAGLVTVNVLNMSSVPQTVPAGTLKATILR